MCMCPGQVGGSHWIVRDQLITAGGEMKCCVLRIEKTIVEINSHICT